MSRLVLCALFLTTLTPSICFGEDWISDELGTDRTSSAGPLEISPIAFESNADGLSNTTDIGCRCSCSPCDCFWCREDLTGDWWGKRTGLAENGIAIESSLTQFYQGVASGGAEQRFRYGAKFDLFAELNTEKMGLWKGGSFFAHAVSWNFGQNSNADATFLAPVNASLTYPTAEPSFAVSSFWYEQALGDQGYAALVGRYDLLDVWALFYPDYGKGLDGFMNVSSFVPFNIVLTGLPPVSNLAGIIKAGDEGVEAAFLVLENANHPTDIGLNFPNGVTLLPTLRKYTKFGGLRGTHTLAAWYATGDFTSFDTNSWVGFPPGLGAIPVRSGSWSATYIGEQRLWQDPCNEKRYTNLLGYIDYADKATNPFQVTVGGSLESFGFFAGRPGDRMGVAGFYNGLGDLSDLLSVLSPAGDVYGGEFYYNAEINPWFHLTVDLQAVRPAFRTNDMALVLGLRGKLDF